METTKLDARSLSDAQLIADFEALRTELKYRSSRKALEAATLFRVGDRVRCNEGKDSKWYGAEGNVIKVNSTTVVVNLDGGRGMLRATANLLVKVTATATKAS